MLENVPERKPHAMMQIPISFSMTFVTYIHKFGDWYLEMFNDFLGSAYMTPKMPKTLVLPQFHRK